MRIKEARDISLLSSVSSLLFAAVAALAGQYGGGHRSSVPGLYGAALLYEGAGGYMLVGVIAFAAAVVVTMLCIRRRERQRGNTAQADGEEPKQ